MGKTWTKSAAVLACVVAALALAACGGRSTDGGPGDAGSATDAAATDAAPGTDAGNPPCAPMDAFVIMGDSLDFSICATHPLIEELEALYGLVPADVVSAFEAADPARAPYDFSGFGSRWAHIRVANPSAMTAARLTSPELDVAILCSEPFTVPPIFYVNDDLAGAAPAAGLDLTGANGPWDCYATTSPHTDLVPANTPLGRAFIDFPPL